MIEKENTVIVANLKAYLGSQDLIKWIAEFVRIIRPTDVEKKSVVICPPATHIHYYYDYIRSHGEKGISLGIQDISLYGQGAYTGEVTGATVFGAATYALVGHSERRDYFGETTDVIEKKIKNASFFGLHPIVCVSKPEKYEGPVYAYAYEPRDAIGTGDAEPIEEAASLLTELKKAAYALAYLYGGSVTEKNAKNYVNVGYSGVLVGTASKDPHQFLSIIQSL